MRTSMIVAVLITAALPAIASASGEDWYEDFDEAVAVAKKEGKDLLVDISGSDWCHWCKVLDKEVFRHAEFLEAVKKDYILVLLDFPRAEELKAKVPNPERNQELFERWSPEGYPTVLLTDADGNVFGRTGYQRGGPEAYVRHLEELRKTGRPGLIRALEIRKAAEEAKGEKKGEALTAALDHMESIAGEAWAPALVPAATTAAAFDADGTRGLRDRAIEMLLAARVVDDEVKAAVIAADPSNEKGMYERYVEAAISKVSSEKQLPGALALIEGLFDAGEVKDPGRRVNFRASAAFWSFQFLKDEARARKHATVLKAMNPENPRIRQLVQRILGE
jgi:thioredoxin-related protein